MTDKDFYPYGAYNDPNAPYNEPVVPEREFDLNISQSLSKGVTVWTDKYNPEYDEEDGRTYANTEDTDWSKVFQESGCHTPLQLIQLLGEVLEKDLSHGIVFKSPRYTESLIKECEDWIDDETVFTEE